MLSIIMEFLTKVSLSIKIKGSVPAEGEMTP
jgi:hypothetical protein